MTSNICEIEKLVELFDLQKNDSDLSDDDQQSYPEEGRPKKEKKHTDKSKAKKFNPYEKIAPKPVENKEVKDPDEMLDDNVVLESEKHKADWKKTPKWDLSYKQQVTASDVFLQMGFKTPSSSSCEDMIIVVELPGENQKNMDLKILQQSLTLSTPNFYLDITLPHPVDPQRGNAQFDKDAEKLTITLRMDRELDFVNF
ncbi:unnamed protein product [Brassicogethes aeneus]|uniref:PIH1D1/2/3 CS-like domain-containing protein n=1 Tax=Brassicogethes aeneus TaxID=1431903 RepID=A0A9P0B9C1_BRAAE|nr:unnamed protein product [Brassicogethes aeneus]